MSFVLLWPAGLAALAALALPLLLHLARRSERRPTDFAALAWLQARVRPRRHVRFDEWLLLAVRLLLVALLALLLAQPARVGPADAEAWIAADPSTSADALRAAGPDNARRVWLAPGFPDATDAPPAGARSTMSLLRELDAMLPPSASLTVLVPPVLAGTDAELPRLSRRVDWRVAGNAGPRPEVIRQATALPTLVVRHAADRAGSARYLSAAATAWQADAATRATEGERSVPPLDAGPPDQPMPDGARLLAWLVPGPLPPAITSWVEAGGTVLVASDTIVQGLVDAPARWHADDGTVLLRGRTLGTGRVLQWAAALEPASMPMLLEPRFARDLGALLAAATSPPDRVDATAHAPTTGAPAWPRAPVEFPHWLSLIAAGLFLVERWLATNPARSTTR